MIYIEYKLQQSNVKNKGNNKITEPEQSYKGKVKAHFQRVKVHTYQDKIDLNSFLINCFGEHCQYTITNEYVTELGHGSDNGLYMHINIIIMFF